MEKTKQESKLQKLSLDELLAVSPGQKLLMIHRASKGPVSSAHNRLNFAYYGNVIGVNYIQELQVSFRTASGIIKYNDLELELFDDPDALYEKLRGSDKKTQFQVCHIDNFEDWEVYKPN